jgi:hypothetical protein
MKHKAPNYPKNLQDAVVEGVLGPEANLLRKKKTTV